MLSTTYLLLISFGALSILGIFHFTIYLQQNDKAFRNYAFYLLVMAAFNVVRLMDARLTSAYPLSYYTVETLDPILSNIAFLMYVNFLGVVLNITPQEKFYYRSWKAIQIFICSFLLLYFILRLTGDSFKIGGVVITVASFSCMAFGLLLMLRLIRLRKEPFFQLIIAGTIISVTGVFTGLIVNVFVYKENLAFGGLYFLEISMLAESVFLSAALGYRLKIAYREKEIFQKAILEETKKGETFALQTAKLLRQELDIKEMQGRISKDLHDDIGSSLSSLQIYSSLVAKLMDENPNKAKALLQQIADNTETIIGNMEDIVWAMHPSVNDVYTIESRIKYFANSMLMLKDIACHYNFDIGIETECQGIELRKNILLIAKEAINNAAKYSNAGNVVISFAKQNQHIVLTIKDDGNGFENGKCKKGNGLNNMIARAMGIGGNTVITSEPGVGTCIVSTIPIASISDTEY